MLIIRLRFDLVSCRKPLYAGTALRVILHNRFGARAGDHEGDIHLVLTGDFEWV